MRVATDIGGTFTDLVGFDEATRRADGREGLTTPRRLRRAACWTRSPRRRPLEDVAELRPRHDGRDQRAHRAHGRADGAGHHRGLPRRARDRPRQPARHVQPRLAQAAAVRARGGTASRCASGSTATATCSCRSSSTTSTPSSSACRRDGIEAVAVCLLHSYAQPDARAGVLRDALRERAPRRRRSRSRRRSPASGASTSAPAPPSSTPTSSRPSSATSASSSGALRGRGLRGPLRVMQSNGGTTLARGRARDADHAGRVRARRPGSIGAARSASGIGEPNVDLPRHRRHDREVLADRGRRSRKTTTEYRIEWRPGLRRLPGHGAGRRHRRDRRRRRLDRLGRRRAARSASARGARAPSPGPPATAAAAASRPSPTRSSSPACSTPTTSSAARCRCDPSSPARRCARSATPLGLGADGARERDHPARRTRT